MVLGKVYKVWHKVDSVYSVLLEKRNDKSQALLFEAEVISTLTGSEADSVKHLYTSLDDAYGCLGVLQLPLGDSTHLLYLVLVNACVSVGKIAKSEIFRITDTTFISLRNNASDNDKIQEIRRVLNSGTFYFSWTSQPDEKPFDLTLNPQRKLRTNETDNRFFWNRVFHLHFIRYGVDTDLWLLKAVCGGVAISTVYVGHEQARACLISRLSSERAGTRFNVRGVDDDGNVANFVETEQSIYLESKVSSYILLRGSVPLFWEQPGINLGSHKIKMSRGSEISQPAYDRHIAALRKRYGKQSFINLMGSKEGETMLTKMFKAHHKASCLTKEIPLINFDYHAQCPRGRQDNLHKHLAFEIRNQLKEFSFFSIGDGVERNMQTGCFRVNCVDCLDRTNSVQTFIGLEILKKQLSALNLTDKTTVTSRFEETFKNMWIMNGDQISRLYAGTGALEGKSKIKDSTLSVARTIQNNLLDSSKQEAFDVLLLGKSLNHESADKARSLLPQHYLHLPNNILIALCDRYLEFTKPLSIKVVVGTWNVNGGKHFNSIVYRRSDPLSDWLLDYKVKKQVHNIMDLSLEESLGELSEENAPPDIYAIGFEEIVDLNASNIVAASTSNQREWLIELQKTISRDTNYVLVTSEQLVGVCLFIFVRPHHAPFIRDVAVDIVKTGLGGAAGNKGGVGIRMLFHNTSLCFLCAHFAAGQSQVQDRNADYAEITRKLSFPSGRTLNSHDFIFWCGDFNYRIDMDNERVKDCVRLGDWPTLLSSDQLKVQQAKGKVFRNYIEGEINFPPTYKYDIESDDYDTSEKCRIPAYTDRILFKKRHATRLGEDHQHLNYGKIIYYGRAELKTSDHRPVIGEYGIDVLRVDDKALEEIFARLVAVSGPQDACILVKHKAGAVAFTDNLIQSILKLLGDEGGEIVLLRLGEKHLTIHFRESVSALKVSKSSSISMLDSNLWIELQTPNWMETYRKEMSLGMNNVVPLCESSSLLPDPEEASTVTSASLSLPNTLCIEDDLYTVSTPCQTSPTGDDSDEKPPPIPGRSTPTQPPSRPPPPSIAKGLGGSNSSSTSSLVGPPSKPPPPMASSSKAKPIPVRPAPPPPPPSQQLQSLQFLPSEGSTNNRGNSQFQRANSRSSLEGGDTTFNMPPPDIPAPAPPPISSDYDNSREIGFSDDDPDEYDRNEPSLPPPIPPPRVDSFEKDDILDEPVSPWQTLPPAPPLPPVECIPDVPPLVPERPKNLPNLESMNDCLMNKPPPIPARTKVPTSSAGPPKHPPPVIPPRRAP